MIRCQKSPRIAVIVAVIAMLMSAAHKRDEAPAERAPATQTVKAADHPFEFDLSLPGIRAHLASGIAR
mgnify:FL=1